MTSDPSPNTRDEIARVLWASIDDRGIEGRLWHDDCVYLADVILPLVIRKQEQAWQEGRESSVNLRWDGNGYFLAAVQADIPNPYKVVTE